MSEKLNWKPDIPGTVPFDVMLYPEQAKAEAMYDREKIMHLSPHLVVGILLDRIEALEAKLAS